MPWLGLKSDGVTRKGVIYGNNHAGGLWGLEVRIIAGLPVF
jgi:hypothetical protein